MDTTKAFARRRKLSAVIWVTLAVCAGITILQTIFSFSLLLAALSIVLVVITWSERRACHLFAKNDPLGGRIAFWNQLILGVLGASYLLWSSATASDLQVQLVAQGVPEDIVSMVVPLFHQACAIAGGVILISQIAIAFYDLRVTRLPGIPPQSTPPPISLPNDNQP